MLGISIKPTIGIGDALQFSSAPENYFRATGKKLVDMSRPWFFDHNPYVLRDSTTPEKTVEMWNFSPTQYAWPTPHRDSPTAPRVYHNNAEIWAGVFGVPAALNRPRLYLHEGYPYERRQAILLQTHGRSHGAMPDHIIAHVREKYGPTGMLFHIGGPETPDIEGLFKLQTKTLWDLTALIAKARMVIAMDSGPSWIAACYPDVISKKLRTKPSLETLRTWTPLAIDNIHAHWDDRCHQIFNVSEEDIGFTSSYRKL